MRYAFRTRAIMLRILLLTLTSVAFRMQPERATTCCWDNQKIRRLGRVQVLPRSGL